MIRCKYNLWLKLRSIMASTKGNSYGGITCKQQLWIFCKGAFYFKVFMFFVKIAVIGTLLYLGVDDDESGVSLKTVKTTHLPTSIQWKMEMCPYYEKYKRAEHGLGFRVLLNIKWFVTLPLKVAKCTAAAAMGTKTEAVKTSLYDCSLSQWAQTTNIYNTWTIKPTAVVIRKQQHPDQVPEDDHQANLSHVFHSTMSLSELQVLHRLLQTLIAQLREHDIMFFLYGDSLIDAYHHHGMAPWRDVLDVAVPRSALPHLKKMLNIDQHQMVLNTASTGGAFFSSSSSRLIRGSSYRWPYIKISFYGENMRQIWDIDPKLSLTRRYERSLVFPLSARPFWNMWLPVPKNLTAVLLSEPGAELSQCRSSTHNHRTGRWLPQQYVISIPCTFLYKDVPLVFRQVVKQGTAETLRKDTETLQTVLIAKDDDQGYPHHL